jgi:AraC-like DNA-binding protein
MTRSYVRTTAPEIIPPACQVCAHGKVHRLTIHYADGEAHSFARGWQGERFPQHEHRHDDIYHLVLYVAGENLFSLAGRRHRSARGVLVLVAPREGHLFTPLVKGNVAYVEVAFSYRAEDGSPLQASCDELLAGYAGETSLRLKRPIALDEVDTNLVAGKIEALIDVLAAGRTLCHFIAHNLMMEILALLIIRHAAASRPRPSRDPGGVGMVKAIIDRRYAESLPLTLLAKKVRMTPEHLCRKFRACHGAPPRAYQQKLRILAAENLLQASGMSCKEIAAAVGFCDEHFFSRIFRRTTGVSPSAFRRNGVTACRKADASDATLAEA